MHCMNAGKALIAALLLLAAVSFASSYEFTSGTEYTGTPPPPPPEDPACLDGNDNDGDGLVDGEGADSDNDGALNWEEAGADGPDPGCSKPYDYDDSEANLYDLDASWIFGDYRSAPTEDDSSIFYGAESIQNGTSVTVHADEVLANNQINETFVRGSEGWAGGELKGSTITLWEDRHEGSMPASTTTSVEDGSAELIGAPHNDTVNNDETQCGDAIRGSDGNNFDCPEDYGLPDDAGDTKSQSSETLSDRFNAKVSEWDANNANGVSIGDSNNNANNGEYLNSKNNNDDTADNIEYRFSNAGSGLVAPEAAGQKTDDISGSDPYTSDLQSGTQANAGEPDDQVVQDQQWIDVPDYYLKDDNSDGVPDELWMVYPEKVGETEMGTVTDYDLTGKKTVETWGKDGGSVSQCSGANCSGTGNKECTSINHDTDTKYTLKSGNTATVSDSGNEKYYADSKGSYQHSKESTNSNQVSVDVTRHPGYDTKNVDDDSCSSKTEEETCDSSIGCDSDPSVDTVGSTSSQTIATGQTSNTITYRYEDLELKSEKVFDLNPAENPSYSPAFPTDALFEGDTFKYGDETYSRFNIKYNDFQGDAYYSYAVDTDNNMLGNDEALSSSSYHMRVDGAAFESVRDYFRTWDVDGPQGQSDGYMAILQRRGYLGDGSVEIQGTSNKFMNTETNNSERRDIVQPDDALGYVSLNTNGCGDPFTHCVAAVDVSFWSFNAWSNPTDPSAQGGQAFPTAVAYETNIQDTNQSLGVCKMYQELDPDAAIGSSYQSDSDSPTQSSDKRCAGDTTQEFWIAMEGPEVNEDAIGSHHLEGTADRITDCLWYGQDVPEGTVRTVGTDQYSDYEEEGYSPDKEVCLAIDSSGESFTQDSMVYEETHPSDDPGDDVPYDNYDYDDDGTTEEIGGEWYDLDNERVNEYLRSSGNGHDLIDSSQKGDPDNASQVAFYWRQNENPSHPDYNPKGQGSGESIGVTLEDNCGPLLTGCDDQETNTQGKAPVFFNFFWQLTGYAP